MSNSSKGPRFVLGVETSCDETCAAVLLHGKEVLSNIVSSQIEIHAEFGGIVPEIASRKHIEAINIVVKKAIKEADIDFDHIDGIAVTQGPGLVGSLVVGLSYAKACAFSSGKKITGVNHVHAHLLAPFLSEKGLKFPFTGLVVSGGHTSLYYVSDYLSFKPIGRTRDDAAGEAFDKVAKILGLPYPGGPVISRLSIEGDKDAFKFPRAMLPDSPFDFSFSGLKTAVLQAVKRLEKGKATIPLNDICASFQEAVVDVLIKKTIMAAKECNCKNVVISGGVAANERLRYVMQKACEAEGLRLFYPDLSLCTDNAAMVALCGFHQIKEGILLGPEADVYSRIAFP